jgi:Flp pilus assembly protein TadB
VIKQFNFYDIYGYLLPGVLLLAILWLPFGILARAWPEQDLSKAIFFALLAYVLGLMVQAVAAVVVPSKVVDVASHQRTLSDYLLDNSNHEFSADFKKRLADQVQKLFGLALQVDQDGDGSGVTSSCRQAAFFQARAYLISKKAAGYAEQFEGLYAMMRGLGSSFCMGAAYLAGWGLSSDGLSRYLALPMAVASALLAAFALMTAWQDNKEKRKPARSKDQQEKANRTARVLWPSLFLAAGFWARYALPGGAEKPALVHAEAVLWATALLCLIAAAKCFTSYRSFAEDFAKTVWRDFSASISFGGATAHGSSNGSDNGDES